MGSIGLQTAHDLYPPFPTDIRTAPLVSISLSKLQHGDKDESAAFFAACKDLGFFYLSLSGTEVGEAIIAEAEQLDALQRRFWKLPQAEREEFAREKIDAFFGYRQVKLGVVGEDGTEERNETYNMRKDDFVGNAKPLPTHELMTQNRDLLTSYIQHCREAMNTLFTHLETHLKLPAGTLQNLHKISARSGDHVRFNKAAPQLYSETRAKAAEHTDFGSLTLLMNWLGGLQVRLPTPGDDNDWVYVKPIPGSAIVNLGDAMVKFTAGIVRSNVHRVVPPPEPQGGVVRTSLVYFCRPEDEVLLRRLKGGLVDEQAVVPGEEGEEAMTAQEWTYRRSVGDLKGVYTHSRGLEMRENQLAGGS